MRLSERTLIDLDAPCERFDTVRAAGYAVSDDENALGLRTVAASVLDRDGFVCAAVSLTAPREVEPLETFVARTVPSPLTVVGDLSAAVRLVASAA